MSTEEIKITYRGFEIKYRVLGVMGGEQFSLENERRGYPSLIKAQEAIDRTFEKKFEKVDVLFLSGYEEDIITEGTATSIDEDGSVWITYKNPKSFSKRTKCSSGVYHDTPANRKVIEEIKQLQKDRDKYQEDYETKTRKLFASMSAVTKK